MSFAVKSYENLRRSLWQVYKKELSKISALLQKLKNTKTPDEEDDTVHKLRQQIKKSRAVLRLLRSAMSNNHYRKLNKMMRDLGRCFSALRDSGVLVVTFRNLNDEYKKIGKIQEFKEIRKSLFNQHRENRKKMVEKDSRALKRAFSLFDSIVREFRSSVKKSQLRKKSGKVFRSDFLFIYEEGQAALKEVRKYPNAAHFHELRKQTKYLRYTFQLFEAFWPSFFNLLQNEGHSLTDQLGEEHDLYVLSKVVKVPQKIKKRIFQSRMELRHKALLIAPRLYGMNSKSFSEQIKSLFDNPR